jgi:hypothetical protein
MSLILMAIILFFSLLQWILVRERKPKHYPVLADKAKKGAAQQ